MTSPVVPADGFPRTGLPAGGERFADVPGKRRMGSRHTGDSTDESGPVALFIGLEECIRKIDPRWTAQDGGREYVSGFEDIFP
ncbi:hypothetical protein GMSM_14210 [Geomonas sp. Red276]